VAVIEAINVTKSFNVGDAAVNALCGTSLTVQAGELLGIV
jgi:ABC-type oligopeptide transport system ATPase subunit